MANRLAVGALLAACSFLVIAAVGIAQPDADFQAQPTWQLATPEKLTARLTEYLNTASIAPDRQTAVRKEWSAKPASGELASDLLDRLAASLAKADDRVADLVAHCTSTAPHGALPEFAWLADSETPLLVRNNMRLYLARWLTQEGYYDEAISWTEGLSTDDVAAPEALLFYRAIAFQRLVEPDKADAALGQLLSRRDELPTRYQKLADLMQQDLAGLKDESLDHIARRMEDVRRRLAQGRSGERVQKVENGVLESLDKMIKDAEDKMKKQQSGGGGAIAGGSPQSQSPMKDSQIAELKAPGNIQHRDIGKSAGWGDMPDKDREKALQDIGREFPSHYREIIEEYFRRLAAEQSNDGR